MLKEYLLKKEKSNVSRIKFMSKAVIPLRMLQTASFVEYYIREPVFIEVKRNMHLKSCEAIFQIVQYVPNNCIKSWQIYADARETNEIKTVLIRKIKWDKKEQIKHLKETKELMPPYIESQVYLCDKREKNFLMSFLEKIDFYMQKGLVLKNNTENERYSDEEINRKYDWGAVHVIYNSSKKWEYADTIQPIIDAMENIFQNTYKRNDIQLIYDFTYPIDLFMKNIISNEIL